MKQVALLAEKQYSGSSRSSPLKLFPPETDGRNREDSPLVTEDTDSGETCYYL